MTKKIIILILGFALLSTAATGCDWVVESITGPIIESQLEDPQSGPIQEIDQAMDTMLAELNDAEVQLLNQTLDYDIEDYEWEREESDISASVNNPPADTSGRVTAGDVNLDYAFTVRGKAQNEDADDIVKEDTLNIFIERIDFDADSEEILDVTDSFATTGAEAPELSELEYDADPLKVEASVENVTGQNPRAMTVAGNIEIPTDIDVENNWVEASSNQSVTSDDFGILAVLNTAVLLNNNTDETGLAVYSFYLQP